ncbi:MAG: Xaa-Pro peptidase family protein [archaeon]
MNSKLKHLLEEKKLDALLLVNGSHPRFDPNFTYFTGLDDYSGSIALVGDKTEVYVPEFEVLRAKIESKKSCKVFERPIKFSELTKRLKSMKLGVNGSALTIEQSRELKKSKIKMLDVGRDLRNMRMIKSADEIEKLRKAVRISKGFHNQTYRDKTEREIAADFYHYITEKGCKASYDPVIAYDARAALPHSKFTEGRGSKCLLIDAGAAWKGYKGDITRTYMLKSDKKLKEIYDIVKTAQGMGIDAVASGVKAAEVDKVVRDYLKKHGYDLIHATGHGIGLNVHEKPYISDKAVEVLEPGMVFSIEPGIYIKGKYGVRIEDDVLVTKTGRKVL